MKPKNKIYLIQIANFITVSFACLGYSSDFVGAGGSYFGSRSSSTALARGAPNARVEDIEFRASKCQRSDFGIYKASELRRLATIYEFPVNKTSQFNGAQLSCNFDTVAENCAWYTVPLSTDRRDLFRRARFETFFDWEKFDCTSDRSFTFEEYFLVIGGKEDSTNEASAAIEARIPCQRDKAMLKFDYWSNNETPILKICVLPEHDVMKPQCEETKMDANPLTFEIPESLKPFRLRIQIEHIKGSEDIAFIDNVHYDGKQCEIANDEADSSTIAASSMLPDYETAITSDSDAKTKQTTPDETTKMTISHMKEFEENSGPDVYSDGSADVEDGDDSESAFREAFRDGETQSSQKSKPITYEGLDGLCRALSCDFNSGDACEYSLSSPENTRPWKLGSGPVGNPHTGIHKGGPTDPKLIGFAYVGGVSKPSWSYVISSPTISVTTPLLMSFDLFQRSVGPELKVCLNSLNNCPYVNPPKPNTSKHWLTEQRVILRQGAKKIFFVASKLRQNLYIAIDNIRLQTIDFKDVCGKNGQPITEIIR